MSETICFKKISEVSSQLANLGKIMFSVHWGKIFKEIPGTVTAAPISQMQAEILWGPHVNMNII